MHVNAAPNPRFKGHGSFDEMAVTGLAKGPRLEGSVVGFYAPPPLQGVITHMGEYIHSHYVDAQRDRDRASRQHSALRLGLDLDCCRCKTDERVVHAAARLTSGGTASSASA